jgi:hypothetical protein
MDSFNCPTKTNISRYYRPIVGLSKNAASTLASPEEMDIKEAFYHMNNTILTITKEFTLLQPLLCQNSAPCPLPIQITIKNALITVYELRVVDSREI